MAIFREIMAQQISLRTGPFLKANWLSRAALLCQMCLLASCFSLQVEDWPDNIPDSTYFVQAWQADTVNQQVQPLDEYLYWVRSFYVGTVVYPQGWLDLESELLALADESSGDSLALDVHELGITIGAEWSKLNEGRLIDNRMLALWGSILQMSLLEDKELQAVEYIAADVDLLLTRDLDKTAVTEARYAERLGLPLFDDFGDF